MIEKLQKLQEELQTVLGEDGIEISLQNGELTLTCASEQYRSIAQTLRDHPALSFEQLTDLSGIDYGEFSAWVGPRFAVVSHLLSIRHNLRLRLRVFAPSDENPVVDSLTMVWHCANWYEREAYDLYGIRFEGHPDLRRILTDYGFVGHPLRKDFPVSGHVEMRFDPEKQTLVYEPVTLEPREVTPRIVREPDFGRGR
jgi:NADH-quinone oxidoreductase subunit C